MAGSTQHIKILMTADSVGGVWTYCMDMCRSLGSFDAEVHLVTMGERLTHWQKMEAERILNVTVYETAYRLEWMEDPWSDIEACCEWLLELEDKLQPHIIHLNCYAYGSLPFKAPVVVVAHSDVWSWYLSVKGSEPPPEWSRYYRVVKNGLHGADVVVAPSEAVLQMVKKIYAVPDGKVVYNGRAADLFSEAAKEPVVFSMGRIWDEAKNIRLLTDAAPLIKAPVRIAGDNQFDKNSFDAPQNKVTYLGKLSTSQVAKELSLAAVYVLPAKYEPFGLSALEAAYSGCALVLGDTSTLREIWQDAAVYVDTTNVQALADTVNTLIEEDDRRKSLRIKAKARAERFSITAMAERYWAIYGQLVRQPSKQKEKETV
jgi:glycogen synthase